MKKFLILLFVTCSLNVFSQIDASSKTVLDKYVIGYDSEKTLIEKGVDIHDVNSTEYPKDVTIVRLSQYNNLKMVTLVFVEHTLYSVRYFPLKDKKIEKYFVTLNKNYKIRYNRQMWYNDYLVIEYDPDSEDMESFVHYDVKLLEKYPQYKDF